MTEGGNSLRDQGRVGRIIKIVGEVADLLERGEANFWSSEFRRCFEKLNQAVANGWDGDVLHLARTIKSWYGGMGSLNDRAINGQDRLDVLLDELIVEVRALLNTNPGGR